MSEITHQIDKSIKYNLANSISHIHDYSLDYDAEVIYLMEDIDEDSSRKFIKNINTLQRKKDCETILVELMTNGGCWDSGMAIYSAIKRCPKDVIILGCGYIYSMGSVILQAGDKRVLDVEARLMVHDGDISFSGTNKQFLTEAEEVKKANKKMRQIFYDVMNHADKWSKSSERVVRAWLETQMAKKEDIYMNPEIALVNGFVDGIFGKDGIYDWKNLMEI